MGEIVPLRSPNQPLDGLDLLLQPGASFDSDGAGKDEPGDNPQGPLKEHKHGAHIFVLTKTARVRK